MGKLHCMIDLETMGNGVDAAIIAIGAVQFDPTDSQLLNEPIPDTLRLDEFYTVVNLTSSLEVGLTMDASTVLWWLDQSEEARKAITSPPARTSILNLPAALHQLGEWFTGCEVMWSHSTFDATILNHAHRLLGRSTPWKLRNALDLRTMTHLFRDDSMIYHNKVKHHALWDAWAQANLLKQIYAKVRYE